LRDDGAENVVVPNLSYLGLKHAIVNQLMDVSIREKLSNCLEVCENGTDLSQIMKCDEMMKNLTSD